MRSIVIVGAGQAGLLLALGLLDGGYKVTLVADRAAEEILHGPVPAGAVVFDDALAVERDLKVNYWDGTAVSCQAVHVDLIGPNQQIVLSIESALDQPGLCVDQRLKSCRWLQEVERRGGRILVQPATLADLEGFAAQADLVVVATGKGELSRLFPRDAARSPFSHAMRHVSMVVVAGERKWDNFTRPGPKFNLLPGIGEIFAAPMYAKDQVQGSFLGFEAIPGGPMDRFQHRMSPDAQLELSKQIYRELLPWDYQAVREATLVDSRACLVGNLVPTVKSPIGRLPSGALVLGLADAVNLHDPIAAQGANNAAKAARICTRRIVARGDQSFDAAWMTEVFEEIWAEAQYANLLADKFLAPPEPHMVDIMMAAGQNPVVARRFLNGFTRPRELSPWFFEAAEASRYLQAVAS